MQEPQDNPQGTTYRILNGIPCKCVDIGCPDFKRAEENRELIANPPASVTKWWRWMERSRDAVIHHNRMPPSIPVGILPIAQEVDMREYILWEQSKEEN